MVSRINHLTNATGAERRQQLVLVAYRLIAEKGFEGLRTRDVADQVGINHATLHYHFPTKEDLIKGVVDYLIQKFSSPIWVPQLAVVPRWNWYVANTQRFINLTKARKCSVIWEGFVSLVVVALNNSEAAG